MNAKQAKELALVDFIQRLGHEPTSRRGNDVWFKSPLNPDERTPSFKVDATRNIWYDFARGEGGTIIDFAERYFSLRDVSSVLATIESVTGGVAVATRSASRPEHIDQRARERPTIESVSAISDPNLEVYLESRAIPLDLARLYLKEVSYLVDGRRYRALAFPNQAGGFEVRSPTFKGSLGTKDITVFRAPGRTDTAIFEGSFDFLSTLQHYGLRAPRANVIVLNSLALIERAVAHLKAEQLTNVYAYLDHDQAGENALARLSAGPWSVQDASSFYQDHKDANEYLQDVARQRQAS